MTKRNFSLNHNRHIMINDSRRSRTFSERAETASTSKQRKYYNSLYKICKEKGLDIPQNAKSPYGRVGFMTAISTLKNLLKIKEERRENFDVKWVYDNGGHGMHAKIIYVGEERRDADICDSCVNANKNLDRKKNFYPCCKCFNESRFVEKGEQNEHDID